MSGTTASGWPYIQDSDEPRDYPPLSLALANKLETDAGGGGGGGGVTPEWVWAYTAPVLVLGPSDPVPVGTAIGTVIVRTES